MTIDFDGMVFFLQALVRTKSLSGEEKAVVDLIAGEMERLGYDGAEIDAYGNVVGIIEGNHPGPTLLMDGHVDTMGIAPAVPWKHDSHKEAYRQIPDIACY